MFRSQSSVSLNSLSYRHSTSWADHDGTQSRRTDRRWATWRLEAAAALRPRRRDCAIGS